MTKCHALVLHYVLGIQLGELSPPIRQMIIELAKIAEERGFDSSIVEALRKPMGPVPRMFHMRALARPALLLAKQ